MSQDDQIAKKIVGLLEQNLDALDQATLNRLEQARDAALRAMALPRHRAVFEPVVAGWGRLMDASHHDSYRYWLPVVLLLAVLAGVISSNMNFTNGVEDADSQLLASDLSPEVYADKEFVAWLEHTSHP